METNNFKAAITISEMSKLLEMSRTQVYFHIKKGVFHEPLRLSNGRPYFNASQVADNLKAKELGIGVNGEYVLFYERNEVEAKAVQRVDTKHDREELLDGLRSLGITNVNKQQVTDAYSACFPNGSTDQSDSEVLRTVFRYLKRSLSGY
jgi:predicted DNA-binding transcriptional regulator AlpA